MSLRYPWLFVLTLVVGASATAYGLVMLVGAVVTWTCPECSAELACRQ